MTAGIVAFAGIIAACSIIIVVVLVVGVTLACFQVYPRLHAYLNRRRRVHEFRLEEGAAARGSPPLARTASEMADELQTAAVVKSGEPPEVEPKRLVWTVGYPAFTKRKKLTKNVEILASGNGLANLMIALAPQLPNRLMAIFDSDPNAVVDANGRIAQLRSASSRSGKPEAGEPHQNVHAFMMVRQSAATGYFARNQLHKVVLAIPRQQPVMEGELNGLSLAERYAQIVELGGLFFAVSEDELAMQSFASEFDAALHHWRRLSDHEWSNDPLGKILKDRDLLSADTKIAVWARK